MLQRASCTWTNLQHLQLRASCQEGIQLAEAAAFLLPGLQRMELTLLYRSDAQGAPDSAAATDRGICRLASCRALASLDLSACWLPTPALVQLSRLVHLQHLDLSGQLSLTSLAFASHMPSLHTLILQGCSAGCMLDLRPLALCSALTSLDLCGSHPRSLEDIPEATLAALATDFPTWPDASPPAQPSHLAGATGGTQLHGDEGAASSAETTLSFQCLQPPAVSTESIGPFEAGSLAALSHCPRLQTLRLARCFLIPSLAPLTACTQLRTLDLQQCTSLTSLQPPSTLPSLIDLDLYGCTGLTSIQPLALSAPSLTRLVMACCHCVNDLSVLSGATRLQQLDVSYCSGIRSLQPLESACGLTHLQMRQTKVSSMAPLSGCPRLCRLDARFCAALHDLQPLASCSSLHTLLLAGCTGITDASPLARCSSLRLLDLVGCAGVRDLAPVLEGCRELVHLDARGCHPEAEEQVLQAKRASNRRKAPKGC